MSVRCVAFAFVSFFVLFLAGQEARAGERELWKHTEGYFIKLKGDHWQERGTKNEDKLKYVETKRTKEFVELFDKNRKVTIRLRKDACMYKDENGEKFKKLYDGEWTD